MTDGDRASTRPAIRTTQATRQVHHLIRHPGVALIALSVMAAVTLIGTFMPWLRSGAADRSSYQLLGMLRRFDLAPPGAVATLVRWWPVVPLLITATVVAAWWRWTAAAVAAAVLSAVYSGGVGSAVIVRTRGTLLSVGPGPWVCLAGGAGMLITAPWLLITSARRRAPPAPGEAPPDGRS